MGWFRKSPPSAAVSVLRVELSKAEMRIDYLEHMLSHFRMQNDGLKNDIKRFVDQVELGMSQDDLWDAIEILRGQR